MWTLLLVVCASGVGAKLDEDEPQEDAFDFSAGDDNDDSTERIGATITQVVQHPYAASLMMNDSYICSAIILNNYWLLTLSKCFESIQADVLASYVTHRNLGNFTIRAGSSYNNKGGSVYKLKMLINNFDHHVTAVKVEKPLEFSSQLDSIKLPSAEDEVTLGYLASMIAWTPSGHIRLVNAPVIEPAICERNTKMIPGHYICLGGVQDPNRHFCRRDNGGAVIQNNTLIAISAFINTCALYYKTHAFPRISVFSRWLDTIIWDEETRPTSTAPLPTTTESTTTKPVPNSTVAPESAPYFADPSKFMLTLPFDPINVPLEPAEDNIVLPRMSLYESYLQSLSKNKASSEPPTTSPKPDWRHIAPALSQLYRLPKTYEFDYN
ncbi:trypsin 3A1-like [Anticarsia gemmatalis]|uniref:trypsin 3A1-like n=1 Tax=Anticarsia gemmatalis TaxID=129554 RepID=UPI003F76B264